MTRLIAWFASNPVAANLLLAFIVVAGLASAPRLRQESFPNVTFDTISIGVVYPGAPADEVETSICVRIEEAIHGIRGIDRLFARATEGAGSVWARLESGADPRRILEEIKTRVDALDTLPEDAEAPIVQELIDDSILVSVVIHGDTDPYTLRTLGERVRQDLAALPEIARPELVGVSPYEISIEVAEAALRRHDLRFDDVTRAVRSSSLDLPGGVVETPAGEILLRAQGRAYRGPAFERIPLLTRDDGTRVLVGDVARVRDGFEDTHESFRFDGQPAAAVRVRTSEPANVLDVSHAVRRYVAEERGRMPEGVQLSIWWDQSLHFEGRRNLLLRNGAQGLALILLVLAVFLRPRLAFWVALGIPLSFLGALVALVPLGVSINMMSLFAFIVALGLVVDDAIIIGENVDRHQREGADPLTGAVRGTLEVAVPVAVAVLTTVFFLVPSMVIPGTIGKIARPLGIVVVLCLLVSVVEALLILPCHLRMGGAEGRGARSAPSRERGGWGALGRLRRRVDASTQAFIDRRYRPWLRAALRWPLVTASAGAVLLMLTVGAVAGGWVRYAFFPPIEDDFVHARLVMPEGTPPDRMQALAARLERAALAVGEELAADSGRPVFEHVFASVGDPPDLYDDMQDGGEGPDSATLRIGLVPGEQRRVTSLEVARLWRERAGPVPGAESLDIWGSDMGVTRPIDVSLAGSDAETLRRAAEALKRHLGSIPGVRDVADSLREGKRELMLEIRPEAEAMGLTRAELVRQLRQGFQGEEVQRVQRGRDDVAVMVRYPPEERRSLGQLEDIRIRLPDGGELPFAAVADASLRRSSAAIERRDRRAIVNVSAAVDDDTRARGIMETLVGRDLPHILAEYPGVRFALDGGAREEAEMAASVYRNWALAVLAAYALLAVPLRSYLQPLVILSAVPFGLVGSVVGHALLGVVFSCFSLVGLVALTGVVINDALVLIDRANRNRERGMPMEDALVDAGATRFRAIVLTSLTTFSGLLPLLFERSAQAAWLEPMAVTLAFGVISATAITLLLVPAFYALVETASERTRGLAGRLLAPPAGQNAAT